VPFKSPVSLANSPRINEWLSSLELEMKLSLAKLLAESKSQYSIEFASGIVDNVDKYMCWLDAYPTQLICLTVQISWSEAVDKALGDASPSTKLTDTLKLIESTLNVLADSVLKDQPTLRRKKLEHLVRD
jgi:dynein heavy chain 1, cytosolic